MGANELNGSKNMKEGANELNGSKRMKKRVESW